FANFMGQSRADLGGLTPPLTRLSAQSPPRAGLTTPQRDQRRHGGSIDRADQGDNPQPVYGGAPLPIGDFRFQPSGIEPFVIFADRAFFRLQGHADVVGFSVAAERAPLGPHDVGPAFRDLLLVPTASQGPSDF